MTSDRTDRPRFPRIVFAAAFVWLLMAAGGAVPARAAQPEPVSTPPGHEAVAGAPTAAHEAEAEGPHEQTTTQTVAKLFNFALLAGALVYFLRSPIAAHLASRRSGIRQDLDTAAAMRASATAQLAEIDQRLKRLPAELEALRAQGAEDVRAEQARIAAAAEAERARLVDQTHREIEARLRVARRELTAHAAQLAVNIAEARIRQQITPDDQLRLVDRFTAQLKEAR